MLTSVKLHHTTNHSDRHPATLTLLVALGVCFIAATAAVGQAPQPPLARQGSHNIAQPTPQQQATSVEISRLDQDAAKAFRASQYAEAEADARQVLALGQDSGIAQEILAASLDALGKDQEALQVYKEIADMGGQFPRNLLPYALLLLKAGHWPEAVTAYDKALPALPQDHTGSRPSVAVPFSLNGGDPTALAASIHVALGLEDNSSCDTTGNSLHERALEEYTKALQLEPNWDVANFYYGYGLQRLGRTTQAIAAFQKTVKLGQGPVKAAATQALKNYKR